MHLSAYLEGRDDGHQRLHRDGPRGSRTDSKMARPGKKSLPGSDDRSGIQFASQILKTPETQIRLSDLPIGARVLVRSRKDWRAAAIARIAEDCAVLTVCSPSGHSYRLTRDLATEIMIEGGFAILPSETDDTWRDNFSDYDIRW